jgi:SAM-dependent methyltransferase
VGRDGESAADRWRILVRNRREEMERLSPEREKVGTRFWDARARRFAARLTAEAAAEDPFLRAVARAGGRRGSFLDVGAGTGRFAINLASEHRRVTAVDPSPGMLRVLKRQAKQRGVARYIETVQGRWEEVDVAPADVAFSSYVVSVVDDAPTFLTKLTTAARRYAFLYLGAYTMDAVMDPLWRHFHGAPRVPGPSYLDAVAVLQELGFTPEVRVVELPNHTRFDTVAEAAAEYAGYLVLPSGRRPRRELEELLAAWLVKRNGRLAPPLRFVPAAIIRWPGSADA